MSGPMLTIVMYHYVRPLAGSAWPRIKGLEAKLFREQLDYIEHHYTPVTMEDVTAALKTKDPLPPAALLLTFDDGYRDHHAHVFPELDKRGLKGAFYPPAATALNREILDVNKVHFLLAATPDMAALRSEIDTLVDEARTEFSLPSLAALAAEYEKPFGYDDAGTIYIKRLLQHALPEALRARITDTLFTRHVSADKTAFAEELYCGADELKEMQRAGHHIGLHGDRHYWLSKLSPEDQRRDIENAFRLLEAIGAPREGFTFCYPYGDHNEETRAILKQLGPVDKLGSQISFDLIQSSFYGGYRGSFADGRYGVGVL
ncbi:polysaccharide deacetylase family protein [Tepidicaulis sp. LMO-SS28]|uniref:polysaccharide deacetylase family protein n=1 Tax=Tepidicaulis sp. LMO-SS28 TaxID=3447455 RepID=UPI003EE1987C